MKSEKEIKSLLEKVDNLIRRIQVLKNPPDDYKMENFQYRVLLSQRDLYRYLLGDRGYEFDEYYDHFLQNLDALEN
ncbi:hypothetical protein [uncultured Aquimarina sp.]|uniref:hypothetical protein n=1 Tax=uncultured Aquimarina sp. TaxID=575652 RepID=UPI002630DE0F|nr:hypothetical protein [uncultured Aquimarina sp.]